MSIRNVCIHQQVYAVSTPRRPQCEESTLCKHGNCCKLFTAEGSWKYIKWQWGLCSQFHSSYVTVHGVSMERMGLTWRHFG